MYQLLATVFWGFMIAWSITVSANSQASREAQRDLASPSSMQQGTGFSSAEARQLLEFCIELNSQDDRAKFPQDSQYQAVLGDWKIVYDSRDKSDSNPESNGFGAFNNAWLLLQSNTDPTQYAIAVRGTVGEAHSIIADFLLTTIPAQDGIEFPEGRRLPVMFAATPKAEVHLGFAYATFTLLFDKQRGILAQFKANNVPENAKLFITGHSQGAAIATLVHSFLYYAGTDPSDRYGLAKKQYRLKSYLFAKPKPGNMQYAADFAHIAASKGLAFVINNDLDPVPQVPLSVQTPADVSVDVISENKNKGKTIDGSLFDVVDKTFQSVMYIRNKIATQANSKAANAINAKYDKAGTGKDHLDIDSYFNRDEQTVVKPATSLNYALAGQLIPVFGYADGGSLYPPSGNEPDLLLQHHATTYRKLINQQIP